MDARRLLSLLAMLALLAMPFGHMTAGAHGASSAISGHCHGSPAPASGKAKGAAIDCAIACAAIAPCGMAPVPPLAIAGAAPDRVAPQSLPGLHLAADPPPPRLG